MVIYIYSDESGVFDRVHNDYFVFGGIICFGKQEKDDSARKYAHVENVIRKSGKYAFDVELKASNITNSEKGKIYRSLNNVYKFCVSIKEKDVNLHVYDNPKHKQRYLDYAYKIALKKCFEKMIKSKLIEPKEVELIVVSADEHTTATDGKYELRENLLMEFKHGMFNPNYDKYFEPIFPFLKDVQLKFADSSRDRLVGAADIVANHCYHVALENKGEVSGQRNMFSFQLPSGKIIEDGFGYFKTDGK